MGYYLRLLSPFGGAIDAALLQQAAETAGGRFEGRLSADRDDALLVTAAGAEVCEIERNDVAPGTLGAEELDEFRQELAEAGPRSAADWLAAYFEKVRVIYAFRVLSGADKPGGWDLLDAVRNAMWEVAGGVSQADLEGFSNEDGDHILWQFDDDATGSWAMAVLKDDRWLRFRMDLGDPAHRAAFLRGEVPQGVDVASDGSGQVGAP